MQFYISATAVRQYMAICGYEGSTDGPVFDSAAIELEKLVENSRQVDVGPSQQCQLWRVRAIVRGKNTRLEFSVSTEHRPEGSLPQLINVRNKGQNR